MENICFLLICKAGLAEPQNNAGYAIIENLFNPQNIFSKISKTFFIFIGVCADFAGISTFLVKKIWVRIPK
jgi:hypothetical protein